MSRDKLAPDTRCRILDSAEELFAAQGIAATSLRALTRAADVNLAAVHYHFGSKEGLLDAVLERRARAVNSEREAELERRSAAAGAPLGVEEILHVFVLPGRRQQPDAAARGRTLSRLLAHIHAESPELVESLSRKHFGSVMALFVEALQHALPHIPAAEVAHRFRFSVGALLHVFSANFDLDSIPGHPVAISQEDELVEQLVGFLAAGMRAPSAVPTAQAAPQLEVVNR